VLLLQFVGTALDHIMLPRGLRINVERTNWSMAPSLALISAPGNYKVDAVPTHRSSTASIAKPCVGDDAIGPNRLAVSLPWKLSNLERLCYPDLRLCASMQIFQKHTTS
jgi:hypothetical protein